MAGLIAEACGVPAPRLRIPVLPARLAAWALEKAFAPLGKEAPAQPVEARLLPRPQGPVEREGPARARLRPGVDFRTGAARAVAWYREHGWL